MLPKIITDTLELFGVWSKVVEMLPSSSILLCSRILAANGVSGGLEIR